MRWTLWAAVAIGSVGCCGAAWGRPPERFAAPTYRRDVAPLLEAHCRVCHRRGQVGPFPLDSYEQARKRAGDLADVVVGRRMPPWKPAPGTGPPLKQDRSLSAAEVAVFVEWARAGAVEGTGEAAARPDVTVPSDGWALGTPDLVLEMGEPFAVPAAGPDIYRCFVIPTRLPHDVYVSAVEYRPGSRRVVHHMTSWVDGRREARKKDAAEPGPGYDGLAGPGVAVHGDLGGWAPGNEASRLPDGIGRPVPRDADVILQVHYHPGGKGESDRSRLGLYFARGPVRQTLQWNGAGNMNFRLPAGQARVEVRAAWVVPVDVEALAVAPHMHRLGKDIRMSVDFPDGRSQDLVHIPDWDMDWQNTYYFQEAVNLPRGSVVRVVGHFDNSSANPSNPNRPPKVIHYGEGSGDEMCVGYIAVVKKGQDLTRPGEADDLFQTFVRQRQDALRVERSARGKAGARRGRVP